MNTQTPLARRSAGFSLIEVLIALLVLAIGLLGLAALQAQGLKFNTDAYVRSQSNVLAHDIMDRIRTNRDNASDYAVGDLSATITAAINGTGTACSQTAMSVNNDLRCWAEDLAAALPGAAAEINANGTDANYLDIELKWLDREVSTQTDCTALASHEWNAGSSVCYVIQMWTVFP